MLKLIREEKTFELNMKNDLQEALQNISMGQSELQDKKNELIINEIIKRKKQEVQEMKEQAKNKEIKNSYKEDERNLLSIFIINSFYFFSNSALRCQFF